jgi:hypothetical protein
VELRKRFPSGTALFTPKPPPGKKMVLDIGGVLVIITFPYALKKNTNKQEQAPKKEQAPRQSPMQGEGFTLGELITNKKDLTSRILPPRGAFFCKKNYP